MNLKLIATNGKHAGKEITVAGPKFFVGRAEDCDLRSGSESVDPYHCLIVVEEDSAVVRDFGSKNGTQVNGEKIDKQQELKSGDALQIGPLQFKVEFPSGASSSQEEKADSAETGGVDAPEPASEDDIDLIEFLGPDDDNDDAGAPAAEGAAETAETAAEAPATTEAGAEDDLDLADWFEPDDDDDAAPSPEPSQEESAKKSD